MSDDADTFEQPSPFKHRGNVTTPCRNNLLWRRDSNQMASDEPGADKWRNRRMKMMCQR